jgi:GMP synthase (glutamine-hydrolysing)
MARLLVLQHIACEPPAAYEDEMLAWGIDLHRVEVDEGDVLPDWRAFEGIVAMGGPMGAYDDERLPWLAAEKRLIADAVRARVPYWGVCLGAQLLAASVGANVFAGARPEVGVLDVELTPHAARDPVFAGMPARFVALQWHGDTYELPAGATRLARSEHYEQQAFVVDRAYGLQFHLEVPASLAREWGRVPAYAESLEALPTPLPLAHLVNQVADHEEEMTRLARTLFARWLEHVVGLAGGASATAEPERTASPSRGAAGTRRSPSRRPTVGVARSRSV